MAGEHGGYRPGAGRPKGMTSKFAEEARALASPYAARALRELAKLGGIVKNAQPAQSEQARVQALREILDRAYGKAKQPVEGEMLHGMSEELRKFIAGNTGANRNFLSFEEDASDDVSNNEPVSQH